MFGDAWRDVYTNVLGALELLQNVGVQLRPPHASRTDRDLNGQVCVVTGGNAGIGKETSQALVARGAHVILACRNTERAEEAAQALKAVPRMKGCQSSPVEVAWLDLASLASVKTFATEFNARGLPLDVLVCNAGIMAPPQRLETADGLEQQFQVNYLGHWLLTHHLLAGQQKRRAKQHRQNGGSASSSTQQGDITTAANARERHKHEQLQQQPTQAQHAQHAQHSQHAQHGGTRVVWLASMTHKAGRIKFDDLQANKSYNAFRRYGDSKLAQLLAVRSFAQRSDRADGATQVRDTVVAVHPGLVQTDLARQWVHNKFPILAVRGLIDTLFQWTFLPPAYAVETVLHAITAPAHEVHGQYVARSRAVKPGRLALDDLTASRLWDVSCHLTGMPDKQKDATWQS